MTTVRPNSEECRGKCEEEEDCQFITFTNFRNIGVCYLLRDCQEKVNVNNVNGIVIIVNVRVFQDFICGSF